MSSGVTDNSTPLCTQWPLAQPIMLTLETVTRLAKMIGYIECKVWKNRLLPHYSRAIIAELGSLCTFMASKKTAES